MAETEDSGAVRRVETRRHLGPVVAPRGQGQDDPPAERVKQRKPQRDDGLQPRQVA